MIDYNAPGRTTGIAGLFHRLRCGGVLGVTRGHEHTSWIEGADGFRHLRCEDCGHVSVGVDEQHADEMHLYHCLNDHDLDPEIEAVVRDRLDRMEVTI